MIRWTSKNQKLKSKNQKQTTDLPAEVRLRSTSSARRNFNEGELRRTGFNEGGPKTNNQ